MKIIKEYIVLTDFIPFTYISRINFLNGIVSQIIYKSMKYFNFHKSLNFFDVVGTNVSIIEGIYVF